MAKNYVNKRAQSNGDHEVHKEGCARLPDSANRMYLGEFNHCWKAVAEAKNFYHQVNGCYYCCRECHTQ